MQKLVEPLVEKFFTDVKDIRIKDDFTISEDFRPTNSSLKSQYPRLHYWE